MRRWEEGRRERQDIALEISESLRGGADVGVSADLDDFLETGYWPFQE